MSALRFTSRRVPMHFDHFFGADQHCEDMVEEA